MNASNQHTENQAGVQATPEGSEVKGAKPKIFAFINGGGGDMLFASAISEDGYSLSEHCSSSIGWAKHDMGIGSDWKHDEYSKHYPQGWDLEWVDKPREHAGVMKAIALHDARHAAAPTSEGQ